MTEKLYDTDSFLKEFTATVLSCEKSGEMYKTVLNQTAFFPEGGGQTSDKGYIGIAKVSDVQIENGIIYHYTDKPLCSGDTVSCSIDWERRFDFMQQHSGEHIVSGVAHTLYGCENVGFHLSENTVTLDFDKYLSEKELSEIEAKANFAVYENVKFHTYYPDEAALKNLTFRSKKEISGDIRIVEIENTDVCACCAPHVKSAGQIGIIKLLSTEKLRGGIRIEIKCGRRALSDYRENYAGIKKISDLLCCKTEEADTAVQRMYGENAELKYKLSGYRRQSLLKRAESFKPENSITAEFCEDADIKELNIFADMLYKNAGGIRGAFSGNGSEYKFSVCGEPDAVDELFKSFKSAFEVKGGGRNGMVQGTVFADKNEILDFFGKE